MRRRLVRGESHLLTPTPDESTLWPGLNCLLGPYNNVPLGDTEVHVTLTLNEPASITAGSLLYVYILHNTHAGYENGDVSIDPSLSCIGAIAAQGVTVTHRVCFTAPIRRSQFKILLRNEWDEEIDFSMHVETSAMEILE